MDKWEILYPPVELTCHVCSSRITSREKFERHLVEHDLQLVWKCSVCRIKTLQSCKSMSSHHTKCKRRAVTRGRVDEDEMENVSSGSCRQAVASMPCVEVVCALQASNLPHGLQTEGEYTNDPPPRSGNIAIEFVGVLPTMATNTTLQGGSRNDSQPLLVASPTTTSRTNDAAPDLHTSSVTTTPSTEAGRVIQNPCGVSPDSVNEPFTGPDLGVQSLSHSLAVASVVGGDSGETSPNISEIAGLLANAGLSPPVPDSTETSHDDLDQRRLTRNASDEQSTSDSIELVHRVDSLRPASGHDRAHTRIPSGAVESYCRWTEAELRLMAQTELRLGSHPFINIEIHKIYPVRSLASIRMARRMQRYRDILRSMRSTHVVDTVINEIPLSTGRQQSYPINWVPDLSGTTLPEDLREKLNGGPIQQTDLDAILGFYLTERALRRNKQKRQPRPTVTPTNSKQRRRHIFKIHQDLYRKGPKVLVHDLLQEDAHIDLQQLHDLYDLIFSTPAGEDVSVPPLPNNLAIPVDSITVQEVQTTLTALNCRSASGPDL